jgi:predicted RNase H-like nuclease (RuvC/YqgF family)
MPSEKEQAPASGENKRARNREHARNSRARKKMKISRVDELEQENARLRYTIYLMQQQSQCLQDQIALLRRDAEFLYVRPPSDVQGLFLEPVTAADLQNV